jgi:hypothetical protein
MLHIIFLLLKIIGIVLLCVLGLILLLLLTTLLVPIRYRVAIRHGENLFYLKGGVSWLLHIVHLSISHIEGILHIRARLFGFVIYDNRKPKKPKKSKKTHAAKSRTVRSRKAKRVASDKSIPAEPSVIAPEVNTPATENIVVDRSTNMTADRNRAITESADMTDAQNITMKEKVDTTKENKEAAKTTDRIKSFFRRWKERFLSIWNKIISFFRELKAKILRIASTISSFRYRFDLVINFLRDEFNKEGMRLTFTSVKKLLKHVLPTKLSSSLIFGTGDPCSTGQALGAMSILYSFYGDRIRITPDFERSIFEGEHVARGRIRLVTILIIVVKLIFDKRFKQLKDNFIILKEAL